MNNYTAIQDREINKDQFTQRFDYVQNSSSTWMGRDTHSRDNEISPALKQNGTKLDNRDRPDDAWQHLYPRPLSVNEFRFGYNSFFNTFGRELG